MDVRAVAIVGAGTMGSGIAQAAAISGVDVTLIDVAEPMLAKAREGIARNFERAVAKAKMAAADKESALQRITTAVDYAAMRSADLVIEAATENIEVKTRILKQVDSLVRPEAIIASNTSSISITKLAAAVSRPERFVGMHFFNPVPVMALVEIVRGLQTSDATHGAIRDLCAKLGKTPITTKSTPGFVVNRLLCPMINEAFFVLGQDGVTAEDVDNGMKLGCNHPIGPLALADLIGLDVLLSVMETLHEEFGDSKYRPAPLLREMVAAGYLGRKTGRGVYRY